MNTNVEYRRGIDGCCGRNPMRGVRSDAEVLDFAEGLAEDGLVLYGDMRLAESTRLLLVACTALLRDWFTDESYNPCGMITVLAMALMQGKYDSNVNFAFRSTSLDLIFRQIERGEAYAANAEGTWGWRKSRLERNYDNVRPGDTGGMPQLTDIASSFYDKWRASAPPHALEESVHVCIALVSGLGISHAA